VQGAFGFGQGLLGSLLDTTDLTSFEDSIELLATDYSDVGFRIAFLPESVVQERGEHFPTLNASDI
jgi:hypothetical protein